MSRTCWAVVSLSLFACTSTRAGTDAGTSDGGDAGPGGDAGADAGPMVLQHHGNGARSGFYTDPAFTQAALAGLEPLPGFAASVDGQVFAQALFMSGGVRGQDALFVATEADSVFAFQPDTGATLWQTSLGTPGPQSAFPAHCGSIYPLGITGTPIIDAPSRTLFAVAETVQDGGPRYVAAALATDDGSTRWEVDLQAQIPGFDSTVQMQRGALALQNGVLYIPFGGLAGNCGDSHGWVVGVPLANPLAAQAWRTGSVGGGIWAPSGVASDSTSIYVATNASSSFTVSPLWADDDTQAILRLGGGPTFSGATTDFFTPNDWYALELGGSQLGASGVVLFDLPGATPAQLGFAIGKTGDGYLVDRANLGGIGGQVARLPGAAADWVEGAMAAYTTAAGTYVAFSGQGSNCPAGADLTTLRVLSGSPPTLSPGWCQVQGAPAGEPFGGGSPIATASALTQGVGSDVAVWGIGTEANGAPGTGLLSAFDGDTGALLVQSSITLPDVEHWISPIVVNGRLYLSGDQHVYAFDLAGPKHPADGGILAPPTADGGPPAVCLVPVASDQPDPCAPFGMTCQGSPAQGELGTCAQPTADQACLAAVGCAQTLDCVPTAAGPAGFCELPCATTADCSDTFHTCTSDGSADGGSHCHTLGCGTDGGALYGPCGTGDLGTCVPFYDPNGSTFGVCMNGGLDDAGTCTQSGATATLCPSGQFCFPGQSDVCLPICNFASATGLDAGGPSCQSGFVCAWLGSPVGFGACAQPCGDGGTCPGTLACHATVVSTAQPSSETPQTFDCFP